MNHSLINVWLILLLVSGALIDLSAQSFLKNPSFEEEPADATIPSEWWSCQRGSTPDILPGFWGVYNLPADGQTYLGLITREDGTFEAVGQRFDRPLEDGICYQWSIALGYSNVYAGYTDSIRLSVYIGDSKCPLQQQIFKSPRMTKETWKIFEISFSPEQRSSYITLMADDEGRHINGNVLIDHIGPFEECERASNDQSPLSNKRW